MCSLSSSAFGGRPPEPWDHLPQTSELWVGETTIGIVTQDERALIVDRGGMTVELVTPAELASRRPRSFARAFGQIPRRVAEQRRILTTSSGVEYQSDEAYCAEGAGILHALRKDGQIVPDPVDPCLSISALEIVGDRLWLGTRSDAEYGEYAGEGVYVVTLDEGQLVGKLDRSAGISGNLVRAIRLDPSDGSIWVARERGISQVTPDLKLIDSWYFYEAFDPESGQPVVRLSEAPKESDTLAVFARTLEIEHMAEFHAAVTTSAKQMRVVRRRS